MAAAFCDGGAQGDGGADPKQRREQATAGHPDCSRRYNHQVVEPGSSGPKPAVARRTVTNHRVKGVGRPEGPASARTEEGKPKRSSKYGIDGVVGQRLDRGSRKKGGREPVEIPSN